MYNKSATNGKFTTGGSDHRGPIHITPKDKPTPEGAGPDRQFTTRSGITFVWWHESRLRYFTINGQRFRYSRDYRDRAHRGLQLYKPDPAKNDEPEIDARNPAVFPFGTYRSFSRGAPTGVIVFCRGR